ncbi:hypothetical protein AHAS_Ahas04G0125100 [Arachis hypogaea]
MLTTLFTSSTKIIRREGLTEIASALRRAAIREARGDVLKLGVARNDVITEGLYLEDDAVSGGLFDDLAFCIVPRRLASRTLVLHQ